jgi:hypothetical protein
MSNHILDAVSFGRAFAYAHDKQGTSLAINIDELASLRFSILLTAKWEGSGTESRERRAELRTELKQLRRLYFDKIDQIAMVFGVQKAMDAKDHVERTITLPRSAHPDSTPSESEQVHH